MKNIYAISVLFLLSTSAFSQTPGWIWAKNGGGALYDGAYSVAVDPSGNSYAAGGFQSSSITFGTTTLNNSSLDTMDIFLVKYDIVGTAIWARGAGGNGVDYVFSVTTDTAGNVIIVGHFESDSIVFGAFTLYNNGVGGDIFVVKYDTYGNELWAKSAGGNYDDKATSVATDVSGNILITGFFLADTIQFDSYDLISAGNYDMFLTKYDPNGNVIWATSAGNANDDRGYAVTVDPSGDVIVAGAFLSSTITIGTTLLSYAGGAYTDIFIAKFGTSGNNLWAKAAGGTYLDEPNALTTDQLGNIFMTGVVYSTSIDFGTGPLMNSGSSFYCEMFLVKYDANGNTQWSLNAGAAANNDIAYSIDADVAGNVYVSGIYGAPITFGTVTLTGGGIFVVKFDMSGIAQWGIGVPGGYGNAIAVDPMGDIYVTGTTYQTTLVFGTTTINNASAFDMFHAKLSTSVNITENNFCNNMSIYPNPVSLSEPIINVEIELYAPSTLTWKIIDSNGKVVYYSQSESTDNVATRQLDLNGFSAGLYFLEVETETSTMSRHILIH